MKYCRRCVTPSSRPRIEYDQDGICLACKWHDKKQNEINWEERRNQFAKLCDKFRNNKPFNCIIPVSGGKDSTYVSWKLKNEFGMTPLCITFSEPMPTRIGQLNLENFKNSGFDHILITPDTKAYKKYAKDWLINAGMPKQPFVVGISTSILRMAALLNIKFIIWGEQGEQEYTGNQTTFGLEKFTREFLINCYYEGQSDSEKYGSWWRVPTQDELDSSTSTWYSLYDDWDPESHAKLAKQKCNFEMLVGGSIGTFTNYSQLSDVMQDLHCYLQFLKFGFGRCTSDASIEIRRGRLTRDAGVTLVRKFDGLFPLEYLDAYLDYFDMTQKEFWQVIDKFANYNLLMKGTTPERPYVLREPCV